MNRAIGLALSGREVKLAYLIKENDRIFVEDLDTIYLDSSLEYQVESDLPDNSPNAEARDVFGLRDGMDERKGRRDASKKKNANLQILYKFLVKYIQKKTRVGINIPISATNYQNIETQNEEVEKRFGGDGLVGKQLIKMADGSTTTLVHDQFPLFFNLLRDVNDFFSGKIYFATMETTEVALANLVRKCYEPMAEKTTAVVYIEDDFTRLVFLRGKELLHISSIISQNAASPQILDVIARKLVFEKDQANIHKLDTILLAGKACRVDARPYFSERFEDSKVIYLASDQLGPLPMQNQSPEEIFSEYAVAVSLAWQLLQTKDPAFIVMNLVPREVRDKQELIKLDRVGYVLLALTGLLAFFFTFQIMRTRAEIADLHAQKRNMERRVNESQDAVNQALTLEGKSRLIETNLTLIDSLSVDHDAFLRFLKKLNNSVAGTGSLWINDLVKSGNNYLVRGTSRSRDRIPLLADKLGGASLNKVTREQGSSDQLYAFELDRIEVGNEPDSDDDALRLANFRTSPLYFNQHLAGAGGSSETPGTTPPAQQPAVTQSQPAMTQRQPATTPAQQPAVTQRQPATTPAQQPAVTQRQPATTPAQQPAVTQRQPATTPAQQPAVTQRQPATTPAQQPAVTQRQPATTPVQQPAVTQRQPATTPAQQPAVTQRQPATTPAQQPAVTQRQPATTPAQQPAVTQRQPATTPAQQPAVTQRQPSTTPATRSANGNDGAKVSQREAGNGANHTPPRSESRSPVPARTEPPRATAPLTEYFIQVASSTTRELAEQYQGLLRKKGYDSRVDSYFDDARGQQRFRVLLGAFQSRAQAEQVLDVVVNDLGQFLLEKKIVPVTRSSGNAIEESNREARLAKAAGER